MFNLVLEKGAFSYDWFNYFEKLDSGEFPTQEECYSKLNDEPMSDGGFARMQEIKRVGKFTTFTSTYWWILYNLQTS